MILQLEAIELLNGIFSMIVILFAIILGIIIMSKYPQTKQRHVLFIGIGEIGLFSSVWSVSVSVIFTLITHNQLPDQIYILIGNGFLPIVSILLIKGFTDLFSIRGKIKQKIIIFIYLTISIIFELYFFYFLFIDYSVLGAVISPVDAVYNLIITLYQVFLLITLIVIGILFTRISLRTGNPELRLKGKLIIGGLISFSFGAIFDIFSAISITVIITARILLMLSSFLLYGGFILPEWLKNALIKE